ncbi:MAG: hypothetical protein ACYTHJ_21215 [Planctomycetota bacterium]|jgi:hypothetical protein
MLDRTNWTIELNDNIIACTIAGELGTCESAVLVASSRESITGMSDDPFETTVASREICQLSNSGCDVALADEFGPGSTHCAPPEPEDEFVVGYTSNVCCWGGPHITITTRESFEAPGLRSSWSGGGISPTEPVEKTPMMGGFAAIEDARDWLCPQFTSWTYHRWCTHKQGPLGGKRQGTAGCSFDPPLPQAEVAPEFAGCPD